MKTNKTLFVIAIDSIVDVITNSSSELFVIDSMSMLEAETLVQQVYPDYTNEYETVRGVDTLSNEELESWICYTYHFWNWNPITKENAELKLKNTPFTLDEIYQVDKDSLLYKSKDVIINDENCDLFKDKIDPERKLWFIYSLGENPSWEMQERLESIATRYHLG